MASQCGSYTHPSYSNVQKSGQSNANKATTSVSNHQESDQPRSTGGKEPSDGIPRTAEMSKTVTEDGNVRRTEITETITERQRIREVEIVVEDDLKTAELPTSARIHTPATPNQLGRAYGEEPENKSSTKTPTTPPQRLTPLGSGQTPPGGRGAQRHTPPPHQRVQPGRPGSSGPKQAQRHPPGQASRQAPGRDNAAEVAPAQCVHGGVYDGSNLIGSCLSPPPDHVPRKALIRRQPSGQPTSRQPSQTRPQRGRSSTPPPPGKQGTKDQHRDTTPHGYKRSSTPPPHHGADPVYVDPGLRDGDHPGTTPKQASKQKPQQKQPKRQTGPPYESPVYVDPGLRDAADHGQKRDKAPHGHRDSSTPPPGHRIGAVPRQTPSRQGPQQHQGQTAPHDDSVYADPGLRGADHPGGAPKHAPDHMPKDVQRQPHTQDAPYRDDSDYADPALRGPGQHRDATPHGRHGSSTPPPHRGPGTASRQTPEQKQRRGPAHPQKHSEAAPHDDSVYADPALRDGTHPGPHRDTTPHGRHGSSTPPPHRGPGKRAEPSAHGGRVSSTPPPHQRTGAAPRQTPERRPKRAPSQPQRQTVPDDAVYADPGLREADHPGTAASKQKPREAPRHPQRQIGDHPDDSVYADPALRGAADRQKAPIEHGRRDSSTPPPHQRTGIAPRRTPEHAPEQRARQPHRKTAPPHPHDGAQHHQPDAVYADAGLRHADHPAKPPKEGPGHRPEHGPAHPQGLTKPTPHHDDSVYVEPALRGGDHPGEGRHPDKHASHPDRDGGRPGRDRSHLARYGSRPSRDRSHPTRDGSRPSRDRSHPARDVGRPGGARATPEQQRQHGPAQPHRQTAQAPYDDGQYADPALRDGDHHGPHRDTTPHGHHGSSTPPPHRGPGTASRQTPEQKQRRGPAHPQKHSEAAPHDDSVYADPALRDGTHPGPHRDTTPHGRHGSSTPPPHRGPGKRAEPSAHGGRVSSTPPPHQRTGAAPRQTPERRPKRAPSQPQRQTVPDDAEYADPQLRQTAHPEGKKGPKQRPERPHSQSPPLDDAHRTDSVYVDPEMRGETPKEAEYADPALRDAHHPRDAQKQVSKEKPRDAQRPTAPAPPHDDSVYADPELRGEPPKEPEYADPALRDAEHPHDRRKRDSMEKPRDAHRRPQSQTAPHHDDAAPKQGPKGAQRQPPHDDTVYADPALRDEPSHEPQYVDREMRDADHPEKTKERKQKSKESRPRSPLRESHMTDSYYVSQMLSDEERADRKRDRAPHDRRKPSTGKQQEKAKKQESKESRSRSPLDSDYADAGLREASHPDQQRDKTPHGQRQRPGRRDQRRPPSRERTDRRRDSTPHERRDSSAPSRHEGAHEQTQLPIPKASHILVCHGETVDEVFPQWTRLSFHSGKYRPYDLNMPAVIPKRPIKYYKNDPPLTEYGGLTAEFMGHGIKMAGYKPEVIFSSPELRCVQTAAAISHAFGKPEPMIHIEPALAEWVQINPNSASEWLTAEQLAGLGYPICGGQEATQLPKRESPEDYSRRLTNFFKSISQPSSPDQVIIIVTNSSALALAMNDHSFTAEKICERKKSIGNCAFCEVKVESNNQVDTIRPPTLLPFTKTVAEAGTTAV